MKNKRKNTGKFAVHSRISKLKVLVAYLIDSEMNMLEKRALILTEVGPTRTSFCRCRRGENFDRRNRI